MWINQLTTLIAAALMIAAQSVNAIHSIQSEEAVTLSKSIELLPLKGKDLNIEEVRHLSFLNHDEWHGILSSDETYWGRFDVKNEMRSQQPAINWIIEFPLIFTDVELIAFDQNGQIQKGRTGQFVPLNERTVTSVVKFNLVQIYIDQGEKSTIYFKAKCARKFGVPQFDLKLYSKDVFVEQLKNHRFNQGLFIGFMMMMLVYNLFLYSFTARDKAYLHYSVYIFGIVLYSAYNSGDLATVTNSFFMPSNPKFAYLGKTSTYLVIFGYLHFLQSFLNLKQLLPYWSKLIRAMLWINLAAFILDVFLMLNTNFNSNISDIATVGNAIVFVLFVFAFCIALAHTEDRNRFFVIGGIILMGIGAVFTIIARINGVDYSTLPFQIGTILEIVIFSLGLVYRRRHIEEENQKAHFELEKIELQRKQDRVEAARIKDIERLKSDLYTNITHEFRTPLQVINGNLEFIEGHDNEKEIIKRNSAKMLRLVNQVLDLSKLESDLLKINLENDDFIEFLKFIIESFHGLAQTRGIDIEFSSHLDHLRMDFDKEKIEHLIYNLISNAIKFTDDGGKIDIHIERTVEDEEAMIQIDVKDNGCGIAHEELPLIFDRYHGSDIGSSTGIGLTYVKELVEAHNGSISVSSSLGIGSTFSILLPIVNQARTTSISSMIAPALDMNTLDNYEELKTDDLTKPILLIIEDNQDVSTYINRLLQDRYQVHVAQDGEEGVSKAVELIPDIIISDVMMPKKDGYQVTTQLKENYKTSHIPIILLTAKSHQIDVNQGLSAGADDYLSKPVNQKELLLRLANIDKNRKILIDKFRAGFYSANPSDAVSNTSKENEFLLAIKESIINNLSDSNYGTDEIRSSFHLSKNQFYRKIKATTGQSPTVFIREIRLTEGLRLLRQSDLNISEVAYNVGFSDPNYFSRMFQKKYGVPPREFNHL